MILTIIIDDIDAGLDEQMDVASDIQELLSRRDEYKNIVIYNENGISI